MSEDPFATVTGLELEAKLRALAALIAREMQEEETKRRYPTPPKMPPVECTIKIREKYACLDVGDGPYKSGKYMVELSTGRIYGIKGYGRVHRGHQYGTLDTINDWYWGGYTARWKKAGMTVQGGEVAVPHDEPDSVDFADPEPA